MWHIFALSPLVFVAPTTPRLSICAASVRAGPTPSRPVVSRRATCPTAQFGPQLDGAGAFRDIQEYPCELDVKIIGDNEGPFVTDMVTLCSELNGQAEEDVQVKWRDKGKYRAITLRLKFENADQVYSVYAAINQDPRVRFKL